MEVDEEWSSSAEEKKRKREEVWRVDSLRENLCASPCGGGDEQYKRKRLAGPAEPIETDMMETSELPQRRGPSIQTAGEVQPAPGYYKSLPKEKVIHVKGIDGRVVKLLVDEDPIAVSKVLELVKERMNMPALPVKLMYKGTSLDGNYMVSSGSVLRVVQQFGAEGHPEMFSSLLR